MIDIDYAPAVFAGIIAMVLLLPALYGIFFVDSYRLWEKKEAGDNDDNPFK
jgi:hypothetical protein